MDKEIQELLQKLQGFTNKAVELLQKGDNISAAFYFSLSSSITAQLAELVKP